MNLYRAIVKSDNRLPENLRPKDITERARRIAVSIVAARCRSLRHHGAIWRRPALTMGTFGGVYIAGGIVPRFSNF